VSTLNVDKVDPSTGTDLELGTSGDTITVPSGATFVVAGTTEITGTNNVQRPNAQALIINGNCAISQRGTSFATMGNGDSQYTLDRFQWNEEGGFGVAELTITQDTDVPTGQGFAKSLKAVCTTIDTSIDSNTISYITQKFEGQNLQLLKKGTANAEKLTLSFWAKSNLTGTFTMAFKDTDNSRLYSTSYSPASADTWEKFIVNIPADTTGAFTDDNATSLAVDWNLQAGTDKSDGALTTAWEAQAEGDRAVGQTNFFSSTSNDFYITGIQLEVGEYTSSTIPPFQHESYGDNLFRCQRYYQLIAEGAAHNIGISTAYNTATSWTIVRFITEMRSDAVTVEQDTGTNYYALLCENSNTGFDNFLINQTRTNMMRISDDGSTGKSQGASGWFECNASGRLAVEDEL